MKRAAIVMFVTLIASSAFGHDFWIATSRWHVAPGATVTISANVGDGIFPRSESVTAPDRVESLRIVGPTRPS